MQKIKCLFFSFLKFSKNYIFVFLVLKACKKNKSLFLSFSNFSKKQILVFLLLLKSFQFFEGSIGAKCQSPLQDRSEKKTYSKMEKYLMVQSVFPKIVIIFNFFLLGGFGAASNAKDLEYVSRR